MIKISAIAILTVIFYVLVKQYKPEYGILIQLASGAMILLLLLPEIKSIIDFSEDFFTASLIDRSLFVLLIKALGITILSQFAADVCRDNGVSALASKIELAGRVLILILTLPMIRTLLEIVMGMIRE